MTRHHILADVLAHLEAERFTHTPPRGPAWADPITPDQAAHNRQTLADALSDDPVVVAYTERLAS